jgi:hypothetical protein
MGDSTQREVSRKDEERLYKRRSQRSQRGIAATKLIEQKVTEIRETSVLSVSSCSTVFEPRLSLNFAHFRKDSSPETEALPRHFRRYAHTPTRRYDRLLWLRLRCVAIFCQKSVFVSSFEASHQQQEREPEHHCADKERHHGESHYAT